MRWTIFYAVFFFIWGGGVVRAQGSIHGKVTDTENNPVEGVAVVLQTVDSVYIDAVLTDTMGVFLFENPVNQTNRLLFQHLLYIPCQKEITISDAGIIRMEAKSYELEGVTVKAERPKVKVENGAKGRNLMGEDIGARHTLENEVTEVNQSGRGFNYVSNGGIRMGLDYTFKNKDKLSGAYYLKGMKLKLKRTATTSFLEKQVLETDSSFLSCTNQHDKVTFTQRTSTI